MKTLRSGDLKFEYHKVVVVPIGWKSWSDVANGEFLSGDFFITVELNFDRLLRHNRYGQKKNYS